MVDRNGPGEANRKVTKEFGPGRKLSKDLQRCRDVGYLLSAVRTTLKRDTKHEPRGEVLGGSSEALDAGDWGGRRSSIRGLNSHVEGGSLVKTSGGGRENGDKDPPDWRGGLSL